MLTISVKNFGPIAVGSVDLKPLTIFVGPSNTGKSYMATAVHAVMRGVSSASRVRVSTGRFGEAFWPKPAFFTANQTFDIPIAALQGWVHEQVRGSLEPPEFTMRSLPTEVRSWLEMIITERLRSLQGSVTERLRQIHGESPEFVRRGSNLEDFRLIVHQDVPMFYSEILIGDTDGPDPRFDVTQSALPDVAFNLPLNFPGADAEKWLWNEIANSLASSALQGVINKVSSQSYYLPAARSGIAQGHKVLSAALVDQSSRIGLQELHIPTLPGITTEFLSYLIRLDRRTFVLESNQIEENLWRAVSFIEKNVLHGNVDLDESAGLPYPEIAYETDAGKFTIEHTSSMVSELAPLILFLKYLVRPGHLLILEEPESHLHPAAQRQLARGIVRLVNAGVRVLITTHSDIFVSQINNLLRASYASKRWLRENGFAPEDCLKHDDVSAYLFRMDEDSGGSRIDALEVQRDVGIEDPMFNQVIHELYEETLLVERVRPK